LIPKKKDPTILVVIIAILEILILLISAHCARIWDILAFNIRVKDPISIQMNYAGMGTDPFWVFIAGVNEFSSNMFYLKGLRPSMVMFNYFVGLSALGLYIGWMVFLYLKKHHVDAKGENGGTASWNDDLKGFLKKFTTPYTKEDREAGIADPNIILGEELEISLTGEKIEMENKRNANVLVIGGSGTGKTVFVAKPNIIQYNASYICTDPSGEIMNSLGLGLMENGYEVPLFSISDMEHSYVFNPFDYVYSYDEATKKEVIDEVAVKIMVETFFKNVKDDKKSGGDPFWDNAANAFMTFAIFYLIEFFEPQERNFYKVLKLTQLGRVDENSRSSETLLDKLVAKSRKMNPNAKCFVSYDTFKLAPSKTANAILITLGVNLNPFGSADKLRYMTTSDYLCTRDEETGEIIDYIKDNRGRLIRTSKNIDLRKLGDKKTALFINIPQANGAYNFLAAMLYSTMFNVLYERAEKVCPNRWHIHDRIGSVIGANYRSEEEALRYKELFANATLKIEKDNEGTEHYYIYNPEATVDETIPEKAYLPSELGGGNGYLREMYNLEFAKKLIGLYGEAVVMRGKLHLPIPVRAILDEFANIGEIRKFNQILATCRKYWLSATVILQSLAQIKDMYDKLYEGLIGNCDSLVFLGTSENETDKYLQDKLGSATIRTESESYSYGKNKSSSKSYQYSSRALLYADEIAKINNAYEIVFIRGVAPFFIKKYDYWHHPNINSTGEFDETRRIDQDYLDKHYRCTCKKSKKKEKVEQEVKNDETTMNGGNADSLHETTGQEPKDITKPEDLTETIDKNHTIQDDDLGSISYPADSSDRQVTDGLGIDENVEVRTGKKTRKNKAAAKNKEKKSTESKATQEDPSGLDEEFGFPDLPEMPDFPDDMPVSPDDLPSVTDITDDLPDMTGPDNPTMLNENDPTAAYDATVSPSDIMDDDEEDKPVWFDADI